LSDQEPVRQILIHSQVFGIGRKPENALCLPSSCVSSNHAELEQRDDHLFLRDLGSTNGTYINGNKLYGETEVVEGDLIQFATMVFRLGHCHSQSESRTVLEDTGDRALALMQFDRLINDGNLFPFFQPIVKLADSTCIGYEILGRSRLFGLQMPDQMFHAASQLNMEAELSEVFRLRGVEVGSRFPNNVNLFVNTHPKELGHDRLYASLKTLRHAAPDRTITLEIHEAASTDLEMMGQLCAVLRDLNIKLAFDDFGVGRARLVELAEIRPDYLKFDMKLTKNISGASANRQEVVALFAKMVNEIGIQTLAEGIETRECHETLGQMGFQLGQGFFYGRAQSISEYLGKQEPRDKAATH
jgi:EAL domain-containing protein (putative c-di-GMP-specific phosphodiesterase class I)